MDSGKVLWFNQQKGFGFIRPNNSTTDLFVHFSGISGDGFKVLQEGELVEFELGNNGKGPCAVNVVLI